MRCPQDDMNEKLFRSFKNSQVPSIVEPPRKNTGLRGKLIFSPGSSQIPLSREKISWGRFPALVFENLCFAAPHVARRVASLDHPAVRRWSSRTFSRFTRVQILDLYRSCSFVYRMNFCVTPGSIPSFFWLASEVQSSLQERVRSRYRSRGERGSRSVKNHDAPMQVANRRTCHPA